MNISFDYNPETKSVTNIKVVDLTVSSAIPKKSTASKTKASSNTITVTGSSMKLSQDALDQLKVSVGDRLCVRFNNGPIVATPVALGELEGGNLITKSFTVACKGKTGETLLSYGNEFNYELTSEGYLVLTSIADNTVSVDTTPKEEKEIQSTVRDEDFTLDIKDGQEIEFDFTI